MQNSPDAHGLPSARHAICPRHTSSRRRVSAGPPLFIKLGTSSTASTRAEISNPTRLQVLMFEEAAQRPQHVLKLGCVLVVCAVET